jgi:hypothetical protein
VTSTNSKVAMLVTRKAVPAAAAMTQAGTAMLRVDLA